MRNNFVIFELLENLFKIIHITPLEQAHQTRERMPAASVKFESKKFAESCNLITKHGDDFYIFFWFSLGFLSKMLKFLVTRF